MKRLLALIALLSIVTLNIFAQKASSSNLVLSIDARDTAQRIGNIGASGCWFSEWIGKYWPDVKREKIAQLLFSKQLDARGNPLGIGLSAWRFNIGGGSTEQGDSSCIKDPRKRVESFMSPNGTYNWSKQAGYQWFLRKAKAYGVENLIAFSNTPPVSLTQNGYGFKTVKSAASNLKVNKYPAYADFLTTVLAHFDKVGLHFNYISPVNEPQWDWSGKPGEVSQEGSPWTNKEIQRVLTTLDSTLEAKKLNTKILTTEAGMLTYLYSGESPASKQIRYFFGPQAQALKHLPRIAAGHSYFTDAGDSAMVAVRQHLRDTAAKYHTTYWESEYSMLADGFREGTAKKRSAMDCALFLAKIINRDLTVGNAGAWQFWNAYEPGSAEEDTRYYLIALHPNENYTDGDFTVTKNLWALGNYSRFVRPGMQRLNISRNDGLNDVKAGQDIMMSAFKGNKQLILVLVNYTNSTREIALQLKNFKPLRGFKTYTTSADAGDNLKASKIKTGQSLTLKARSVTTVVFN